MINKTGLYTYNAIIESVYDGDTVTASIDLGMGVWKRGEKLRLAHIDAPEVKGLTREQGLVSRDWLRGEVQGKQVIIKTIKDKKGKYGRYLAELWLDGSNINDRLVKNGFAIYKDY